MIDKIETIKVVAGNYRIPITLEYVGQRIFVHFKYNKAMIAEIKDFEGARYHGFDETNPKKIWSIKNSCRNIFQLKFLMGENPYKWYDKPIYEIKSNRPLYKHQYEAVAFGITRHYCIFAMEMGTGKTLAAIEIMESITDLLDDAAWYIGPKSGVYAVSRELIKWNSKIKPRMYTYEALVRELRNNSGTEDFRIPKIVIFDESSKIKTPTAQRSEAALYLSNAVRETHGENGYVILMSGTPAPKAPTDWWNQCEVACPGFLKEGNINKFKARMCLIEERQSITGGVYPHIVTWLDDENKCAKCGQIKDHPNHTTIAAMNGEKNAHGFEKSMNEVQYLYKRLHGLVLVKFKKDCLDLPDKQYKIINVKPTPETLRAAKLIKAMSPRAIQALTLLRELSDGFQYNETKVGEEECPNCKGTGKIIAPDFTKPIDVVTPTAETLTDSLAKGQECVCDLCGGTRTVPRFARTTDVVTSPKDEIFIDMLDEQEDRGRFIVWGGFTGTIDRLTEMAHKEGWSTLRIDGRGFIATDALGNVQSTDDFLDAMDLSNPRYKELIEKYPKITVVGHPQAGGMALTFTAALAMLYYSNSFNGEARMQSEDRAHRAGMDTNIGLTIIDLIHLPSDQLVLDNLKRKKKLQNVSMGELEDAFKISEII